MLLICNAGDTDVDVTGLMEWMGDEGANAVMVEARRQKRKSFMMIWCMVDVVLLLLLFDCSFAFVVLSLLTLEIELHRVWMLNR